MTEEPKVYNSIQEALLNVAKEGKKKYNESMSAPVIIPNWDEPVERIVIDAHDILDIADELENL